MEFVTLAVADGTSMEAYAARPAGAPKAGLLVFQEAYGVNAHIRNVADRFAREGYLAIAPELFHRTAAGFDGSYTDFAAALPHIKAMSDAGLEADLSAAFNWLRKDIPRLPVSAIGYCMGGRAACLAAITLPLTSAISYYGGGIGPGTLFPSLVSRLENLKAPLLMFWGGLDQNIGPDNIRPAEDALRDAKKPYVSVNISYAGHGFFCDARPTYHAGAASEAWALTMAFLNSHQQSKALGAGSARHV